MTVRRAFLVLPFGVLAALAACDVALGLGDLKDRGPDGGLLPGDERDQTVSDAGVDGAPDGGRGDAGWPAATSCVSATGPGLGDCGPGGSEGCCATSEVAGGTHSRSNNATYPATVTGFRLDRFEVTVGRFRPFLDAVVATSGYRPAAGAGKHAHLNGGQGLALVNGGYELGWNAAWNGQLPATRQAWAEGQASGCDSEYGTWSEAVGSGDARAMNCVTWYEAYAFCIWDGGFLPSEAEWSHAAAGGAEQRTYPWSNPPSSEAVDCSNANYGKAFWPGTACSDAGTLKPGTTSPAGDGKWGQADLGGNLYEWSFDGWVSDYANPCVDCANTAAILQRVFRGGAFKSPAGNVLSSYRRYMPADWRNDYVGFRCARPL